MKIQNIASMVDEEEFDTHDTISKLTGKFQGEKAEEPIGIL